MKEKVGSPPSRNKTGMLTINNVAMKTDESSEIVMVKEGDINAAANNESKKKDDKVVFRRLQSMKDTKTAMEKFIDKFWQINVTRVEEEQQKELKVAELDSIVHDMIH